MRPEIRGRLAAVACLLLLPLCLPGCAVLTARADGRARWEKEVRARGLDPSRIAYPLAYDAEMKETAEAVAGGGGSLERLRRLQEYLFNGDRFDFDYESESTYTATEAFERRSGNCVAFTSLFIALARSLAIPARAALLIYPDATEQEGDLVIVRNHIVAVHGHGESLRVYDFYRLRKRLQPRLRFLSDIEVTAIYLNNLGGRKLLAGDELAALEYFEEASALAPGFLPTYANLGVVRRRLGNTSGALDAYRAALRLEPREPTILNNLAALYASMGREEEAAAAARAAKRREATPYLLIVRGNIEIDDGNFRAAAKLFRRAAKLDPLSADPLLAIARAEIARGRRKAARRALSRALLIDPGSRAARELLDSMESTP